MKPKVKHSWVIWLEVVGDKFQTLPLLEYICREPSDGSGSFLDGSGLWDASWHCLGPRTARRIYRRLRCAVPSLRTYVRLRLLQDFDPAKRMKLLDQYKRGKAQVFQMRKPPRKRKRVA